MPKACEDDGVSFYLVASSPSELAQFEGYKGYKTVATIEKGAMRIGQGNAYKLKRVDGQIRLSYKDDYGDLEQMLLIAANTSSAQRSMKMHAAFAEIEAGSLPTDQPVYVNTALCFVRKNYVNGTLTTEKDDCDTSVYYMGSNDKMIFVKVEPDVQGSFYANVEGTWSNQNGIPKVQGMTDYTLKLNAEGFPESAITPIPGRHGHTDSVHFLPYEGANKAELEAAYRDEVYPRIQIETILDKFTGQ